MIRVLVLIAVTGFLVSLVTLSSAIAIGGPELLSDGMWNFGRSGSHWDWTWSADDERHGDHGPQTSREIAWSGGDELDIDVPADVTYTQAAGAGKVTISGPQREVDNIVLENGRLHFRHHGRHWAGLQISVTAPAVTHFDVSGTSKLSIASYRQDKLDIDLSGDAEVSAAGEAKTLSLSVSGSGDTDLSALKVGDAAVDISGSGDAKLAPTGKTVLDISGSGEVTLLSRPSNLISNISGSGSVHQEDSGPARPEAPQPPAPPAPPGHHGRTRV